MSGGCGKRCCVCEGGGGDGGTAKRARTVAEAAPELTPAGLRALGGTAASWAGADLVSIEQMSRPGVE